MYGSSDFKMGRSCFHCKCVLFLIILNCCPVPNVRFLFIEHGEIGNSGWLRGEYFCRGLAIAMVFYFFFFG